MKTPGQSKRNTLIDALRHDIVSGQMPHGSRLPTEFELMRQFDLSRDTVRKALDALEKDGIVVRKRPQGTFVNYPGDGGKLILSLLPPGDDIAEPYHYIMPGIQEEAERCGMKLECGRLPFAVEQIAMYRDRLAGAVIFGGQYTGDESYIRLLQSSHIPVIMAGCFHGDCARTGFAGLISDRRGGWECGIRALLQAGHRRIATLAVNTVQGYDATEEYIGFLRQNGLDNPELLLFVRYKYDEVSAGLRQLWSLPRRPTAIICHSDFMAILLYRAAAELGIDIPHELAVMGFADYPGAAFLNPPLATVSLAHREIGRSAARLLASAHEWFAVKNMVPPEMVFPHTLIMRRSAEIRRCENILQPLNIVNGE